MTVISYNVRYVLVLMTLHMSGGAHFMAMFRFRENEWIFYDGIENSTCKRVSSRKDVLHKIGWLVYVNIRHIGIYMKSMRHEVDQLIDRMPEKFWKKTPQRQER